MSHKQAKQRRHDSPDPDEYEPTAKKKPQFEEYGHSPVYNRIRINNDSSKTNLDPFIHQLRSRYEEELENSQYTEAEHTMDAVNCLNKKKKKQRLRTVSMEHSREKKFIRQAHGEEMRAFNSGWMQIFQRHRDYERMQMRQLQELKERDTEIYRRQVMRRCQSAKPVKKISQIQALEKIEAQLRKRGRTQQLKAVRSEKKKLKQLCEQEHKAMIDKIVKQEQHKFEIKQTKRYHSFMHRISETRQDTERKYRREERRLKQKYKNILKNLEHEQKVQMHNLTLNF